MYNLIQAFIKSWNQLKLPPPPDLQITLDIRLTLTIRPTPMSPCQHFGFSWKSYVFYSQEAWTVCKKSNIFYPVSSSAMEALLLQAVIVQVLLMLLLKVVSRAIPCWGWWDKGQLNRARPDSRVLATSEPLLWWWWGCSPKKWILWRDPAEIFRRLVAIGS